MSIEEDKIPQASLEPLSTASLVVEPCPFSSKKRSLYCVITSGAIRSFTVTVAVVEVWFPLASLTVNVTVFYNTDIRTIKRCCV